MTGLSDCFPCFVTFSWCHRGWCADLASFLWAPMCPGWTALLWKERPESGVFVSATMSTFTPFTCSVGERRQRPPCRLPHGATHGPEDKTVRKFWRLVCSRPFCSFSCGAWPNHLPGVQGKHVISILPTKGAVLAGLKAENEHESVWSLVTVREDKLFSP